jgi:hypothetical protein
MAKKLSDETVECGTLPELRRVEKVSGRGLSPDTLEKLSRVRAGAVSYRAAGRKRLARAFNRMRESTKHLSSADAYEMVGELHQLTQGDDSAIPDDREAGDMLSGIANAIELAFDLGRYEGGDRGAREAVTARAKRNSKRSATKRKEKAADWHAVLPPLINQYRSVPRAHPAWKSRRDLASIAAPEVERNRGRKIAEATIADAIEEIEKKGCRRSKVPRRRE